MSYAGAQDRWLLLGEGSWSLRFGPVGADAGDPERDVFHLAAVGDGAELDDGVERDLDPGQFLLGLLQEVAKQAPEKIGHH